MKNTKKIEENLRLEVDENNLLEEWRCQASMMLEYGIQLADARQEEDETRAELAVVVSELDLAIRENPSDYGLNKTTETSITNAIPGQRQHREAAASLRDARHTVHVFQAAVNALEHRKRTLQGMTDLWLRQWYADPSSSAQPKNLREAQESEPTTKEIPGRKKRRAKK